MQASLQTVSPSVSDRQWAAGAHVLALTFAILTAWLVGIAGVVGAGIVYFIKRDDSPFAAAHAKEAINFNLTMLLYSAVAAVIAFLLVGATVLTLGLGIILTAPAGLVLVLAICAIALMWLVCSVIAAFKAWNGEMYRYPLTLRLF